MPFASSGAKNLSPAEANGHSSDSEDDEQRAEEPCITCKKRSREEGENRKTCKQKIEEDPCVKCGKREATCHYPSKWDEYDDVDLCSICDKDDEPHSLCY